MTGLGHRETAGQFHGHRGAKIALMVRFSSQTANNAAEQAELHAYLDQQRKVDKRDGFKGDHGATDVSLAANLTRKEETSRPALRQAMGLLEHALPMLLDGKTLNRPQQRLVPNAASY